jgi:hypothetical protein
MSTADPKYIAWVSPTERCVRFPNTKAGALIRSVGDSAIRLIEAQPGGASPFVF